MSVRVRLKPNQKNRITGSTFKDVNIRNITVKNSRKDLDAIKNRIDNLFSWTTGSRVLFPTLGNALEQIKYEPMNEVTITNAKSIVRDIMSFEPEVTVTNIQVTPNEDENELRIRVDYLVPKLEVTSHFDFDVIVLGGSGANAPVGVSTVTRTATNFGRATTSVGGGSTGGSGGGGSSGGGGGGGY